MSHQVWPTASGGFSRQYRVQVQQTGQNGLSAQASPPPAGQASQNWRVVRSFRNQQDAERCRQQLGESGLQARVRSHRICPAS